MWHKEALYSWFIFITLIFVAVLFLSEPFSMPTGYAVSLFSNPEVSTDKLWDFSTSSDYTYNSSAISMNGTAQLVLMEITTSATLNEINESSLLFATEYEDDTENRTTKVNSLGNGHVQLDDGKAVLEVILDTQLENNDILSLYILTGTDANGRIYLCNDSAGCSLGEYGSLTLPSSISASWYNLTLSEISSASDTLFIDSPDKIKIDMVKGYKNSNRTETTTALSYPFSASIQTADFQPINWKRWDIISKTEQLNRQTINYSYSANSGSTWTTVPSNSNLSLVAGNKIRFRIELNSNTTATPMLDTLTLAYITQQPCTENWTIHYGSCLLNDTKLKYYTDVNECDTASSLPADNNTYVSCDYCVPQWDEMNSSCRKDDFIKATFSDRNNCYASTGLASDNLPPASKKYSCNYCVLFNCSRSTIKEPVAVIRDNKIIYMIDAILEADTKLEIENQDLVEIVYYTHNIKAENPSSIAVNKYVDIESNATAISSMKIILYYNETEVITLDENTLKIYYYNETSKVWDALSSTANTTGNYVYALVPHMSLYGLFGQQPDSSSGGSASASGNSGGGSRKIEKSTITPSDPILETVETVLPTKSEPESVLELNYPTSEASCDYVVEINLPDQITLGTRNSYEGEIVNKGNCGLPSLKVELSSELRDKVQVPVSYFENLPAGNKTNFVLIRTQQNTGGFFGMTSYVVGNLRKEKISGLFVVEGKDEQEAVFRKELPLEIVLEPRFPWEGLVSLGAIFLAILIIFGGMMARKGKRRKKP